MGRDEKQKAIAQYAFSKGVVTPAEVEDFTAKLAAACPTAVAEEKGLTDTIDKAYEAMLIEQGQNTIDARQTTAPAATPTATVTAEEANAIRQKLASDHNTLMDASQKTVIEELVLDSPAPSEIIAAGTVGMINEKSWKNILDKYADKVMDDDDPSAPNPIKSRTNFNALQEAFNSGKPVAVYIGDQSKKPVALKIKKPASVGAGSASEIMSMKNAENFVVLETAGFVLATESTAGAKLRYIKSSPDKRNPGQVKPARAVLALTNKNKAIEAGNYSVSKEVTSEIKKDAACKSELCFRVDTGKPKQNGQGNITRLVRVTVNADIKATQRKPEYIQELGSVGAKTGAADLLVVPDAKAMEAINKAQVTKIAALRNKVAQGDDFGLQVKYGDALNAFGVQAAPASNVTV